MSDDLTYTFTVTQSPAVAYAAVNDPRGWWSADIGGTTDELGADQVRNRRLAGAREPGEPQGEAALAHAARLGVLVSVDVLRHRATAPSGASAPSMKATISATSGS